MKKILVLFFISHFCWAQKSNGFENDIYQVIDIFVAKPSLEAVQKLSRTEQQFYTSPIPKTNGDWLALVILKCNKAYYLNQFEKSDLAINEYEEAWQILKRKRLTNYDIIEYCLKPLGNLYTIKGDYLSAENTIKEYYYLANTNPKIPENNAHKISALLNLSAVYQSSGKHNQAINLIEETALKENSTSLQKARFYNNLGNNYLALKQFSKTEVNFKKSIAILEKENSNSFLEISNAYKNLAQLYQQQNNFPLAEKALQQSMNNLRKVSNSNSRQVAKLEYAKALLLFQKGDIKNCHLSITKILKQLIPNYKDIHQLPSKNQLYQETILIDVLDLKANLYTIENKPKKALEAYSLSFYIEDLLQSDVFHEESRIVFQVKNRNRVEKCLLLLSDLFQKEKNNKYGIEAFQLTEKYKSSVLNYMVSKISNSGAEEQKLIEKIQQLNSLITKEQLKLEQADIAKINQAIQTQNEAMLQLKKASKIQTEQKLNINSLFEKLEKDKTELISYFYGTETIFMFHIKNEEISFHKLQQYNALNLSIRKLTDFFSSSGKISENPEEFTTKSFEVYKRLQLDKIKNSKNILIIPDGALNYIPFESLITQQTATVNFSEMPFLIHNTKITYNHSASFYLNSKKIENKRNTILGVFPVFSATSFSLPFSKEEYKYLSKNFEGKYFLEKDATYSNFKKNSNQFDILHLSTHASSGDIYEPAQIKFIDQDVSYNELYHLKTKANLVVLSACETGIGKMYQGEGFMSVARGFQMGGTQNVVFSLWKVNDFTTFKLIEKFYSNLKQKQSYSNSLHKAKLDFLKDKTIPNTKKSPYYWSSLVYYGSIAKENQEIKWLYVLASLCFLGLILLLINKKRIFYKS